MPTDSFVLAPLLPVLAVVLTGLMAMILDLWRPADDRLATGAAALGLAAAVGLTWRDWSVGVQSAWTSPGGAPLVVVDPFARYVWAVVLAAGLLTLAAGYRYRRAAGLQDGEYLPLLAFATAGMMLMAAANDLVLAFLALETFSLGLYVLTGFRSGDARGQEAALKYFVLGSFSAAVLLYGTGLLFAGTASTNLSTIGTFIASSASPPLESTPVGPLVLAGLALVLVGLAFKLSLVPFHQWTPDVYTGASAPIAGFMSAGTKAASAALLVRVLWTAFPTMTAWAPALAAVAAVTLVFGNLVALVQSDIKRMLGYSAIAHAGAILIAVMAGPPDGTMAALFYVAIYALTSLGAFAVVAALGPRADGLDASSLDDLRGLGRRHAGLAAALTLFLVSLAGLPPTAGFLAKWYVFRAAAGADLVWLAVVLVLTSAIAAFTYLRPVALMYFAEPVDEQPLKLAAPAALAIGLPAAVLGLALLLAVPMARSAMAAAVPGSAPERVQEDGAGPGNPAGDLLFVAPDFEKRPPEPTP